MIVVREKAYREKSGLIALTLHALAHQLADPAGRFGSFTCATLGWLFVSPTVLHFTEDAFALQLFLQDAKRLINIVVSYGYVHGVSLPFCKYGCKIKKPRAARAPNRQQVKSSTGRGFSMMKAGL